MTTSGSTRNTPNLSLKLASKRVRLHFQANVPSLQPRWLLAVLGAALIWWLPSLTEYINIFISLLRK